MFGVYLRVRILTFFVIKVLKEVLLKKTKTIFAHIPFVISSFCDGYPMVLPLPYLPHFRVLSSGIVTLTLSVRTKRLLVLFFDVVFFLWSNFHNQTSVSCLNIHTSSHNTDRDHSWNCGNTVLVWTEIVSVLKHSFKMKAYYCKYSLPVLRTFFFTFNPQTPVFLIMWLLLIRILF